MAVYKSAYTALQVLVRPEIPFYHPVTGVETSKVRRLTADFGVYGQEQNVLNPLTGGVEPHAIIQGHYFDTVVAAQNEDWTDDERASVEITLDNLCRTQPFLIAKVDLTPPAAIAPWPTYDTTSATRVVQYATSLGLVIEALRYEQENENRPKIVEELQTWLQQNPVLPVEDFPGMITL